MIMKRKSIKLQQKLWYLVFIVILVSLIFSYFLSKHFYETVFEKSAKDDLYKVTTELAKDYHGGPLTQEFIDQVKWYNDKATMELIAVTNPKELSACNPFDVQYTTLVNKQEREQLLQGKNIYKREYSPRFNKDIVAVITPLLDGKSLEGVLYGYIPLSQITEVGNTFILSWIFMAILFTILMFYIVTKIIEKFVNPLKAIEQATKNVSKGDFSTVIKTDRNDEIGNLAVAFNKMSQAIQEEDERKRSFLADISHELRTPLSYVKGYTQLLIDGFVKDKEVQDNYLKLIARETNRLQALVQDLLDLTKLESNAFKIQCGPIAFAQFIEDFMDKYSSVLKEKDLHLELDLCPDVIINGDEHRIEQVIQNIMENAIRYSNEGDTITISLVMEDQSCVLSIEDNGIGISEKDLTRITERFYRVNKARSRFDGGTGLGLSIVEKLMDLHNGSMVIESKLGFGTKVSLHFPILMEDEQI
ncbi:sensor histidine kinase [Bacillus sp. AP8]|uniref:sensor histidine kinase n=2 Tax=Bacillus TaxID=1386 RepID=UPI0011DC97B2|nr:ATP-binding protein [Bacillus sp. AP8]